MEVNQITKITVCLELFEAGLPKSHIADKLGVNRETVRIWLRGIDEIGLSEFTESYLNCKKGERIKRKIDPLIKSWIWEEREENKDCCGQKIRKYLFDEHKISLSVKTIYKVLGEKYKLRSKWKKNQIRGPVPHASHPREVIQMDTVDFGEVFAFTGVDIFSKEVDVLITPSLTSHDGLIYLETSMQRRFGGHSDLIQTDGGPEFKDEFKSNVLRFSDRHRVARPYKKNEQSYIESFNRSLRKECLGWNKYKQKDIPMLNQELYNYLNYYHMKRAHLGLNLKTPNQFLKDYLVADI
jgi:transposase InsO family protein